MITPALAGTAAKISLVAVGGHTITHHFPFHLHLPDSHLVEMLKKVPEIMPEYSKRLLEHLEPEALKVAVEKLVAHLRTNMVAGIHLAPKVFSGTSFSRPFRMR